MDDLGTYDFINTEFLEDPKFEIFNKTIGAKNEVGNQNFKA